MRLADVLREMDSQPVIRVGNTGTRSNSEATGAAPSIMSNKKNEGFAVNCLGSACIDLTLYVLICRPYPQDDNLINVYVDSIYS